MKLVIQRVLQADVTIENKLFSSIQKGVLVLFGVEKDDKEDMLGYYAQKLLKLRIFEDENGKMNKSLIDINGEILAVSQFTLCADCKKVQDLLLTELCSLILRKIITKNL